MRFAEFEELSTSNLILRKFRYDDAEQFYTRVSGSEQVSKYMLFHPHKTLNESQASIEKILSRYEAGNTYTWAIALRLDDSVIGRIDLLRFDEAESSCSFAYMLGKGYWGHGYGTEALSAVLKFAFEKLQMQVVVADHMSENIASGTVMKKVGMNYVKTHTAKYEKDGISYDADEYRISYEDWRKLC